MGLTRFLLLSILMGLATVIVPMGYPAHSASFTVAIGTGTVNGKLTKILVDAKGMALYSLSSDKGSKSACTGGCAQAWPPLLSAKPTAPASLPGKLTILQTANGTQVAYKGHLLYRYAGDTKPGQVNGDDQKGPAGGEWYVAMPNMKASVAPTPLSGQRQMGRTVASQ